MTENWSHSSPDQEWVAADMIAPHQLALTHPESCPQSPEQLSQGRIDRLQQLPPYHAASVQCRQHTTARHEMSMALCHSHGLCLVSYDDHNAAGKAASECIIQAAAPWHEILLYAILYV